MSVLFITGLSGVGKSSVLDEMKNRDYQTVDLDIDYMTVINGERLINDRKLQKLINQHKDNNLVIAGTESNQGKFYNQFTAVILLTAHLDVMLERIDTRTNNQYGKTQAERDEIIQNYKDILPLLKKSATQIIDSGLFSVQEVCNQLEENYLN